MRFPRATLGGIVALLYVGDLDAQAARTKVDTISLTSVVPSQPVRRGVPVDFELQVTIRFNSADSGSVLLMANTDDPKKFRRVTSVNIHRGLQTITLTGRVVPTDWGSEGQFALMVSTAPQREGGSYSPTVSVRQSILTVP